jgi:hypothetical protein
LGFLFHPYLFFALFAQFPDDALGTKFTIPTGIRARLAVLQTFLTISDFHFLALDESLTVRVKTAIHGDVTSFENHKFLLSDPAVSIINKIIRNRDKMQ